MSLISRAFLAAVLVAVVQSGPAAAESFTLVHVNDFDRMEEDDGQGGFARYAAVLEALRASRPNVIATHGGDMISPSLLSGIDHGAHIIALNNAAGLDVATLGNHEFDFGPDVAMERIREAEFAFLSSNVTLGGDPFPGTESERLFEVGDYRVGFFGLTTPDTVELASPGPRTAFEDVVPAAERAVAGLRRAGADVIVALAHESLGDDLRLADVEGVDVILSGHDHEPMTLLMGDTLIHKSGAQAEYVGAIEIEIAAGEDEDGIELRPRWEMIPTRLHEPDPAMQDRVAAYEEQLDQELGVVIGRTETPLDTTRGTIRTREAAFGNLVADVMREATGAEIAITNGGGIRADKIYPAGTELMRRDILSELPFGNATVLLRLTGAQILAALENGFSQLEERAGRFPQIAGMTVAIDSARPAGERVVEASVSGAPLDPTTTYTVATNDYMADGGDGYTAFESGEVLLDATSARLTASQVIDHIEAAGRIAPEVEGRIVDRAG